MAQRRMFALKVIDTDMFLDMPATAQLLYFHLAMRADDDGFVASPKKIMKMVNSSDDDLRILLAKQYVFAFETGVCVIKDWKIHNYIQKDRYQETVYLSEKNQLAVDENGAYTKCIQSVSEPDTQVRLGKVSIGKDKKDICADEPHTPTKKFIPPTLEEVKAYCQERHNNVDPEKWHNFYAAKDWMIGKNKIKDWKAAVRTWETHSRDKPKEQLPDAWVKAMDGG